MASKRIVPSRVGRTRKGIGGWKRGARAGRYTDMQLNIACRIRNGFDEEGCSYVQQAAISLGYKTRGECSTRIGKSVCHGVGVDAPQGEYGRQYGGGGVGAFIGINARASKNAFKNSPVGRGPK